MPFFEKTSLVYAKKIDSDVFYSSEKGTVQKGEKGDYIVKNIDNERSRAYIVKTSNFENIYGSNNETSDVVKNTL